MTKLRKYTIDIIGLLLLGPLLYTCSYEKEKSYIFFLHGRYLEDHTVEEPHPKYDKYEYEEIIRSFEDAGFEVISELRPTQTNARNYALEVKAKIDSLLAMGTKPNQITVIGTSKGGYIAQYVSTFAQNPDLNFVFIASFMNQDIDNIPEINFCGNILTIFEKTDPYGVSAIQRKETSNQKINHFKEIELNTGLGHGFIFKALSEWVEPSVAWARQNYFLN